MKRAADYYPLGGIDAPLPPWWWYTFVKRWRWMVWLVLVAAVGVALVMLDAGEPYVWIFSAVVWFANGLQAGLTYSSHVHGKREHERRLAEIRGEPGEPDDIKIRMGGTALMTPSGRVAMGRIAAFTIELGPEVAAEAAACVNAAFDAVRDGEEFSITPEAARLLYLMASSSPPPPPYQPLIDSAADMLGEPRIER